MSAYSVLSTIGNYYESRTQRQIAHPDRYQGASDYGIPFLLLLGLSENYVHKECIAVIDDPSGMYADFSMGSALKYLWRLGEKHPFPEWAKKYFRRFYLFQVKQDMQKAAWYLRNYAAKLDDSLFRTNCYKVAHCLSSITAEQAIANRVDLINRTFEKTKIQPKTTETSSYCRR